MNPFRHLSLPKPDSLSPYKFVLSHKSSPSNNASYKGLITDYLLLTQGSTTHLGEPTKE